MKKNILFIFCLIFLQEVLPQGVSINNTGLAADTTAMLDITSTEKGVLMPRLTTAQRDAIINPAQSLLIYNTTTQCFEFWANSTWQTLGCACDVPAQPSAITGTSPVCQEQSGVTYTVTNVSGVTYTWSYSGTGFTVASGQGTHAITANFSAVATSGTLTVTPSNSCGNGVAQTMNFIVSAPPTTADAGTDITLACDSSTAILAGNTPTVGTGNWSVVSGTATITAPSSPTSGVTGLTVPGTATLRWTISNPPCADAYDEVVITTTACFTCGTGSVTFIYNGSSVTYGTVARNGKCWMDRNLGATQVATSSTNVNAYGDLFQWGRLDDGHQIRTSGITSTQSTGNVPGHSNFIKHGTSTPYDWRIPQNNNLWQGVSGINNPCPTGWRIPTYAEFITEKASWSTQNAAGAFGSTLKFPVAGYRVFYDGSLDEVGLYGRYWSSTVDGTFVFSMYFNSSSAATHSNSRADGFSVRCIMD